MSARKIVSADDHMDMTAMPRDLWEARLPAEWRDRAPHVRETENGAFWEIDGNLLGFSGTRPGGVQSAITRAGIEDDGFRASTPDLRLQDMDLDGVHAQVIYGPPMGFKMGEAGFKTACLRAYNDWGAEFNGHDPGRLCLLAYLPTESPEAAAAELERAAGIGHKGAVVSYFDAASRVCDPEWDHLWAAAETRRPAPQLPSRRRAALLQALSRRLGVRRLRRGDPPPVGRGPRPHDLLRRA